MNDERGEPSGTPVGRRVVSGLLALGGAGVLGRARVQNALARVLGPLEYRDPTGPIALFPLGEAFRFYSVTETVPTRTAKSYRLTASGLVTHPRGTRWPISRRSRRPIWCTIFNEERHLPFGPLGAR